MARYYNHHSYLDYISYFSMPLHLFFFIFILFSILCLSWYINYESKVEDLINQFLCHFPRGTRFIAQGGSPWGVALLLVLLLFMISHQSSFHERWFPLYSK
ncbi:EXPRESSED PROTEIN-RELATED-RELATED [Salix viminalis]|uniref:EXPRESSED PROTEIN-RELATED-RELATED n=1 Tax=Salix viminalis TaxID=40686 RepID=A0A9Q0QA24_SALVM|nr:EXPRESSED PROTEIN-RELATED-RELATED [Salix viminalis]